MPAANKLASRGRDLAERLRQGKAQAERAPRPGARDLPALKGLTQKCIFTLPLESVLAEATAILVACGRIYRYGDTVALEVGCGGDRRLVTLARDGVVEPNAAALLANHFVCRTVSEDGVTLEFAPPRPLVALLLNSVPCREALPCVRTLANRPVFDAEYNLLGPGWHPEPGVLVLGPEVEPALRDEPDPELPPLDRLPPGLRDLLSGFCFRSPADLVNAVAAMLTAILIDRFVSVGKPLILLDGNQAGLGKTLMARILGILLDGRDPALIHYSSDDEELAKRICATLRGGQSLVLIDNAKVQAGGAISSPVLEANSMAPQVSLRILGQSANFTRPNDLLWVLTMNDTRTSPDLVSRGLPIRLHHAGDPRRREFRGPEPISYATAHRAQILGELAGMVVGWNQLGRPEGPADHRCGVWARLVGSILRAAGLPEFLGNLDEAAASFNQALDELAALAEAAVAAGGCAVVVIQPGDDQ